MYDDEAEEKAKLTKAYNNLLESFNQCKADLEDCNSKPAIPPKVAE